MNVLEREEFRIVRSNCGAEIKKVKVVNGQEEETKPSKKDLFEIVKLVLSKVPR